MRKWLIGLVILTSCGGSSEVKRDRFFLQGNQALQNGEPEEAISFYNKAIKIDSNFARAYNNRGVAKMEDDRPFEAIQDYTMAISIDTSYFDAVFNRAYAYEQAGRVEKALQDVNTVKKAFPDSSYVYFYQGLLETRLKSYEAATASFKKALILDNQNEEALINLATLQYFKGRLDSAKFLLKDILQRNPAEPNALNTLSQIYLAEKDYQNALITVDHALEVAPSEPYFLNNRGLIHLRMGNWEEALKDINRSIFLDPQNAWAYRNKGIYYLEAGDPEQALRLLEQALHRNTFIDELYTYIGLAHWQKKDREKACDAWNKGMEEKEEKATLYYQKHCL